MRQLIYEPYNMVFESLSGSQGFRLVFELIQLLPRVPRNLGKLLANGFLRRVACCL